MRSPFTPSFHDLRFADGSVLGICVFYILNPAVAHDLDIRFEAQTWIIVSIYLVRYSSLADAQTAFATPFAAFLLFWGRVSDLYSPTYVFVRLAASHPMS